MAGNAGFEAMLAFRWFGLWINLISGRGGNGVSAATKGDGHGRVESMNDDSTEKKLPIYCLL